MHCFDGENHESFIEPGNTRVADDAANRATVRRGDPMTWTQLSAAAPTVYKRDAS